MSLDLTTALARAVADINRPASLPETLQAIVDVAQDSIPGIDHVGITLSRSDGELTTEAASDDVVLELDRVQFSVRQGPCVDAVRSADHEVVVLEHARTTGEFHRFVRLAAPLGLRSAAAVRLFAADRTGGVLNLYSTSSDVVSEETRLMAGLFALHAAHAYGHRHQVTNLRQALENRELIGNAVGIVMERFGLDRDRAFEYLVRVSATSETKLRVVAEELVTGVEAAGSQEAEG